jgi:hypothetical protein
MADQAKDESIKSKAESKATDGENAELSPEELRGISGGKPVAPKNVPITTGPIVVNYP